VGVIELEPVEFGLPGDPEPRKPGELAVLAIESGPEWRFEEKDADATLPARIDESEGGGKRPLLSYGLDTPIEPCRLPVGQRVEVVGMMYRFPLHWQWWQDPRHRYADRVNWDIERAASAAERDRQEHLLQVRKLRVLSPTPQPWIRFEGP
jgi:hypothetical protein